MSSTVWYHISATDRHCKCLVIVGISSVDELGSRGNVSRISIMDARDPLDKTVISKLCFNTCMALFPMAKPNVVIWCLPLLVFGVQVSFFEIVTYCESHILCI